jgi:simple sugar transport system ATP-binding protein
MASLVEMRCIHKAFGAVKALDGASLSVEAGEVLGLVGDNAAGKSTLMKVLSGAYQPDKGHIHVDGAPVRIASPADARALGIEMVYQDLALTDNLDVVANLFMGREVTRRLGLLDSRWMREKTLTLVDRLKIDVQDIRQPVATQSGLDVSPRTLVGNLTISQRQLVEIAKALAFDARLIIMDEPTAALSATAADKVLDVIRGLKDHGVAVIIINHRMDEVRRVTDRIAVIQHGKVVGDA